MAQSLKHTHNFKYQRHNKVFDDFGDNLRDLGNFIRQLKAKGGHIELRSPRHFEKYIVIRDRRGAPMKREKVQGYSLTWYTRKNLGLKRA